MCNNESAQSELRTTIHEFGHLFMAPDHYGNGCMSTDEINYEHPGYGFSETCIYGENRRQPNVTNNLIICEGCKRFIRENSGLYN